MQRQEITTQLLQDVKNNLDITWDDPVTNAKVSGWISSGTIYINLKLGGEQDYETDGLPRTLLMEYTRYARDAALDVFENNYRSMILAAQHERMVADAANTLPPEK